MNKSIFSLFIVFIVLFSALFLNGKALNAAILNPNEIGEQTMTFTIQSSAFQHNERIPQKYTCEGEDISPPLEWSSIPEGTKSLVLIVDDPDAPDPKAPTKTYVHWVLYNIPPDLKSLPENIYGKWQKDYLIKEGINDFGREEYGGPCPPIGEHRYFFKLYALNSELSNLFDQSPPTKAQVEKAMQGKIIAEAQLIGTYIKVKK